ncbi:MAG: asparagine synthase (glutamine-hydrolyzing) [Bacteroidetes bacterium]|nr:asparagine synthase (glutamine-hydrolyzing) [Bacteroidota bacterium]
MCGIFGYLDKKNKISTEHNKKSLKAISHRGPDDLGEWTDLHNGIYLSQVRLAILDLSPAGHQPMVSITGRYVMTFNGEIYNHQSIRKELGDQYSIKWKGHSDTETFLAALERWGLETALEKSVGMFAIGIWDCEEKELILARDRMGEKPLYYGWQNDSFIFGSDLAAIEMHESFQGTMDREALALFMQLSYIPAPFSIYKNIYKLEPGTFLRINVKEYLPSISRYWSLRESIQTGAREPFGGSPEDAVEVLNTILQRSIHQQMIADVPIGAFLSGGIDSSVVVAIMQSLSNRPIQTFTIGFDEKKFNEAEHAKAVAKHIGVHHTELYISPKETLDVIPELSKIYSEPFADSSQIPTYLVSKLARREVTVSLSGDAGDELFCGYRSYSKALKMRNIIFSLPEWLRNSSSLFTSLNNSVVANFSNELSQKIDTAMGLFSAKHPLDVYQRLITRWLPSEQIVIGVEGNFNVLDKIGDEINSIGYIESLMALDMLMYLPDNNLCKVDRAAMAVSLETRVPLLDHRIVEFANSLPLNYKLNKGVTKWPLRQILYKHVPKSLVERPKMGFSVPLSDWLKGPLREWAEYLLSEEKIVSQGVLNYSVIKKRWAEQLSGKRDSKYLLWNVLIFQSWMENKKGKLNI